MSWVKHFGLRTRLYIILSMLILVALIIGTGMVWYSYLLEYRFTAITARAVAAFTTAEELSIALANQKGFVSYYYIDNNPEWLDKLHAYRQKFEQSLKRAHASDTNAVTRVILDSIDSEYAKYITTKEEVLALYRSGDRQAGSQLHDNVRSYFFTILQLCDEYKSEHALLMQSSLASMNHEASHFRIYAGLSVAIVVLLGIITAIVLKYQILTPISLLATEVSRTGSGGGTADEVAELGHHVRHLIKDVDDTYDELNRSRTLLMQSEKMAVVGKLAADMAHSLRSPMTSIEMRLYSLEQKIDMPVPQREDFEAIKDDLSHLDMIIGNFLEFSRPPKLKKQPVVFDEVIDASLRLMEHRLKRQGVIVDKSPDRVEVCGLADPELLREVFVNLIDNACDAMADGGRIDISSHLVTDEDGREWVNIAVKDTGPGIAEDILDKLWVPFFTTRDDGTGLGLSIAMRIINEHGGRLDVQSIEGNGATFYIILPIDKRTE